MKTILLFLFLITSVMGGQDPKPAFVYADAGIAVTIVPMENGYYSYNYMIIPDWDYSEMEGQRGILKMARDQGRVAKVIRKVTGGKKFLLAPKFKVSVYGWVHMTFVSKGKPVPGHFILRIPGQRDPLAIRNTWVPGTLKEPDSVLD